MADLFLGGAIGAADGAAPAQHPVHLATDKLTTHGVIVGMTGSGKTGLGVVLIEEILRAGLPVLAIDPKGDLTNLCLTFPDLAPDDFAPWVDEAQARNAGSSTTDFAATQASTWRDGLAGWGLAGADIGALRERVDFTVYTPGSGAGIPMNLVGSLNVPADMDDAEVVADEIEAFVSGLLQLVGIAADPLSSREHILLSNLIDHSWRSGRDLDLMALVGMIAQPPIRKLGVFDLDQFFPPDDRMALAMRLNGLLAAPSFATWASGPALDVQALLHRPDGAPRCAIVSTAHLSDDERQFVTSLLLSKVVSWMRRQSGTTDLRALLYMDEVAGYLPPSQNPATKKPIMTLLKQARAFGLGVVLSTQNPVDVDYKALSNAGTWMIGRLQTERDKARLLDGLSSASGEVDLGAVGDTISGLGKREFALKVPGSEGVDLITSRWAMSYLRGPMTREQIATLMDPVRAAVATATGESAAAQQGPAATEPSAGSSSVTPGAADDGGAELAEDESAVMPEVADGTAVRFVDVAAPWLTEIDGDERGDRRQLAAVARVSLRYDETKADLTHDTEFEAVLFPLTATVDAAQVVAVDYDDRDLRTDDPGDTVFVLTDAKIDTKTFWNQLERDIRDHLTRQLTFELPANEGLKLYGRPGESADDFAARCRTAADDRADEQIAGLRDKYEAKATKLRDQLEAAEDRVEVLEAEADSKRNSELLSGAGSLLGDLLGGRKSKGGMLGGLLRSGGTASRRRGSTQAAQRRVDAAENKAARLAAQLDELEAELTDEVAEIEDEWATKATELTTLTVGLEKTDVRVTQLVAAWVPVTR